MGRAIELITGLATQPNTGLAATALTGNSFTIRDTRRDVKMIAQWDTRQVAGVTSITSPLLHDSTVGIQHGAGAGLTTTRVLTPPQYLSPQDTLSVTITGSNVAGDIEFMSMLVEYDDLPGVSGRFATSGEVDSRIVNLFTNEITVASGTSGQYTGSVAINSGDDLFKANTDYALVGYQIVSGAVHAVRFVGPDWGNLGVGGPAIVSGAIVDTANWFRNLGRMPIMNSANKALTTIDCVADENGANPQVMIFWAQLK